jgi:hypothetical protein
LTIIIKKLKKKQKNEIINDLNFGPRPPIGGGPWAILGTETDQMVRFSFGGKK